MGNTLKLFIKGLLGETNYELGLKKWFGNALGVGRRSI